MAQQQKQHSNISTDKQKTNSNNITTIIISVLLAVVISFIISNYLTAPAKIAYIDTGKLMVGFNDANRVNRELKGIDDEWKKKLKVMQDSLASHVELMSREYDKSSAKRKKELQELLSAHNYQINNFREANNKKMQKLQQEKMQDVLNKANVFLGEYGKKHNYSIIFGTVAGGSILYGNQDGYDITGEIIAGLNERYK